MFRLVVNGKMLKSVFKSLKSAEAWINIIWSVGAARIDIVYDTGISYQPISSYEIE
jgi:hypothetical protein